jgi:hypothetical protein
LDGWFRGTTKGMLYDVKNDLWELKRLRQEANNRKMRICCKGGKVVGL